MTKNLTDTLPATGDETGTTLLGRHLPRIIGITEQRLRARNQGSWTMSAKAWKKLMRLVTPAAKR